jgi:hypothetical protein
MPRTAQAILDDSNKLHQQLADATAFREQLERDVAAATDALELADEKAIAALQTKKTQLELAPRKLAQIEARIEALELEADDAVTAEAAALSRRAREQHKQWLLRLVKVVRPFCATDDEAVNLAGQTQAIRVLAATGNPPARIGSNTDRLRRVLAEQAEFEQFTAELAAATN